MNLGWPGSIVSAVGGVVELAARLPDIEQGVAQAGRRAQETLQGILDRVEPVSAELDELQATARRLEGRLEAVEPHLTELESLIDPLERRFVELTEAANRLDGALVHVLDRVPGLSADDARDIAEHPR